MKVKKNKTNIRERLTSLLDFKQVLSGLSQVGINMNDTNQVLDVAGDVQADDYDLHNINKTLDVDAVDIYIYDTTQDSDGGAWRHQTKQNSWYNESLGTDDRGARREFPAVALIVAEADKLTIFDADDPELSMWMVFEQSQQDGGYYSNALGDNRGTLTCCCAKNATIVVGGNTGGFTNLWEMNLLTELVDRNFAPAIEISSTVWTGDISQRNQIHTWLDNSTSSASPVDGWEIVDVDITVLPDAPIDQSTGLQVPTIMCVDNTEGLGRGGKVFIKNHHRQVITITSDDIHGQPNQIKFAGDQLMIKVGNNYDRADTAVRLIDIPSHDINLNLELNDSVTQGKMYGSGDWAYGDNSRNVWQEHLTLPIWSGNFLSYQNGDARISWIGDVSDNKLFIGANQAFDQFASQYSDRDSRYYRLQYNTGLSEPGTTQPYQVSDYKDRRGVCLVTTDGDESRWSDMCAHITHNHNTGWMPGNNKLTTLCDTTPGSIGTDVTTELITSLTQAFPLRGWSVNMNDGGNFDENSFQVNSDGNLVAVTINANAGQSYFKSPFITLSQLGITTDQNYRMTVKARTTSTNSGYRAYVSLYQRHHGDGDPDGSNWGNGGSSKGLYKTLTDQSTTFELDFRSSNHAGDFLSVYFFMKGVEADQEIIVEEISIKRNDNLISNGDFTEYGDDSSVVLGWSVVDGDSARIVNDQLEVNRTTDNVDLVSQLVHVTPDTQHVISFEVNKSSTGTGFLVISKEDPAGKTPAGAFVESELITQLSRLPVGKYSIPFYPTQDKVWVMFKCNGVGSCLIDNVMCKLAERDRSSIGHGLFVNGQIEKSPVEAGAELVAYHGFTPDNYISQHFNHEMHFGNSDWYMSFWFKKEPGGGQYHAAVAITGTDFETSPTGGTYEWPHGGYISTYIDAVTQSVVCSFRGLNDHFYTTNSIKYTESRWQQIMYMRRDGILHAFMNGNLVYTRDISGDERTPLDVFARKLYIGKNILAQTQTGTDAQITLVKVGAGAPTDQQIKQIYHDESCMFKPGTKCTLQHDTDNIQSMCYDPSDQLLHVGTRFSSLRGGVTTFNNLIVHDTHKGPSNAIASKSNIYIQQ